MIPRKPDCPRCGYDLTGQIATWKDECPVTGTCPECGLVARWYTVLLQEDHPNWFVEKRVDGGTSRRVLDMAFRFMPRAVRTFIRLGLPHRFWRHIPLGGTISLWRAALFPIALLFLWQLFSWPAQLWWAVTRIVTASNSGLMTWEVPATLLIDSFVSPWFLIGREWGGGNVPVVWSPLAGLRATGLVPLAIAVAAPLLLLALSSSRAMSKVRAAHVIRVGIYGLWPLLLIMSVFALAAIEAMVLGVTRAPRATRVMYGVYAESPSLEPAGFSDWAPAVSQLWSMSKSAILVATLLWLMVYWFIVINRYLRLPQAGWVWLSLVVIGGLLTAIILLMTGAANSLLT